MIEVQELDRPGTLARASAALASITRAEAELLALAAHWADLHDPASLPPVETEFEVRRRRFEQQYGVQPGGEGTPEVLASCFAELGLQTSAGSAKHLVADALDLRHRLPRLWEQVQAGQIRRWKAVKVAQATRHLPSVAMAEVDAGLAGLLSSLPWSRFEAVLDATVMRADPAGAAHAEAEAASRRFVSLGRDGGPGLKTLIARGEVLDILTFLAAVTGSPTASLTTATGTPWRSGGPRRSGSWASPTVPWPCSPPTRTTTTRRPRRCCRVSGAGGAGPARGTSRASRTQPTDRT